MLLEKLNRFVAGNSYSTLLRVRRNEKKLVDAHAQVTRYRYDSSNGTGDGWESRDGILRLRVSKMSISYPFRS